MSLTIRAYISNSIIPSTAYPRELQLDPERNTNGIPCLHGALGISAPRSLVLVLRIHNGAGIPIIEGQTTVSAGQQQFTFEELHPIGIDAYSHKKEAERIQIAQRIWLRRAYGTLAALAS